MRKYLVVSLLITFWLLPAPAAQASEWQIDDDHSNAYFSVQHLTVAKVRGNFSAISGTATIDDKTGLLTALKFTVDVNSIDTGVSNRDEDLRSPNFFEVAKYPTMIFVSKGVEDLGYGTLLVTGDLTIHGVTRETKVTAYGPSPAIKDPWGLNRRGLRLESKLNRQDFGMNYNKMLDTGGLLIGNLIEAEADLEIVKK